MTAKVYLQISPLKCGFSHEPVHQISLITTEFPGAMGHGKMLGFGKFEKHTTLWERPRQDDRLQKLSEVVGFRDTNGKGVAILIPTKEG